MKSVHAHGLVADFAPRAVFADNSANHNREIGRTASGAERAQLLGALTNAEGALGLRVGMRFLFDKIAFDVTAEFVANMYAPSFQNAFSAGAQPTFMVTSSCRRVCRLINNL